MRAEAVIRSELALMGHRVVRVLVYQSVHGNQRDWPMVGVECQGEIPRYDVLDSMLLRDEPLLRAWCASEWAECSRAE